MADLFAHYKNPPNNSYLNLLQPGPILQQSCLGLQIMSWFCSLLSLRHICVKKVAGAGGGGLEITCFTSIDRKKLVTTSFLLQFRFLTFFLKNQIPLRTAGHRTRNSGTIFISKDQGSQTKTLLLMSFIQRIFTDVTSSQTFPPCMI